MTDNRSSQTRNALRICDFLMIAAVAFILVTALAMMLYPGGDYLDNDTNHYSLTRNFFSDLGATRTYSHAANGASMVLFIVSLNLVGVSIILFSFNLLVICRQRKRGLLLSRLAVAAAVMSGLSIAYVVLLPGYLILQRTGADISTSKGLISFDVRGGHIFGFRCMATFYNLSCFLMISLMVEAESCNWSAIAL